LQRSDGSYLCLGRLRNNHPKSSVIRNVRFIPHYLYGALNSGTLHNGVVMMNEDYIILQETTGYSRQLTDLIAMCPSEHFRNLLCHRYELLIAIPAAH
jgi:hypothetical protein